MFRTSNNDVLVTVSLIVANCFYWLQSLPNFGPYKEKKEALINETYKTLDLLDEKQKPEAVRPALQPKKLIPNVKVW